MKTKTIYRLLTAIAVIFIFSSSSYAQKAFYFGADATVAKNDVVKIRLNDYVGDIQWQRTYDLNGKSNWEDIPGANTDSLVFFADTTSYYRAQVIAGHCDPFYSDTTFVSVYQLKDEVVIVDPNEFTLISDSTEMANGVFRFTGDPGNIDVGSVILGQTGDGFLRKVTSIEQSGEETVLQTDTATLEDVFNDFMLQDSLIITLNESKTVSYRGKELPLEVIYLPPGASLKKEGSGIDFSNEIIYSDDILKIGVDAGSVKFEPVIKREFDYKKFVGIPTKLNGMKLMAGGRIEATMGVYAESTQQVEYKHSILIGKFGVVVPAGPVPITITLSFYLGFNANMEIEISATAGFESSYQVAYGAEYTRDAEPQWKEVWEEESDFTYNEPTFTAQGLVEAKAYIKAELAVKIAGMAGPTLAVDPYLRFKGEVIVPNWNWELAAGIGGNLGFKVGMFGYDLLDYNYELFNYESILASGSSEADIVAPTVSTTPISNLTATSATSGGNVTSDGGANVTARGVVWSKTPSPTLQSNLGTTPSGTGVGTFVSNITGLTPSTKYYVRAYATNSTGTGYGSDVEFTTLSGQAGSLLNGLISYWKFDETSGTTTADSQGSNDGALSNSRIFGTDGKINKSADFTKGDDVITTTFSPVTTSSFSWQAWIKINGGSGQRFIISTSTSGQQTNGVHFELQTNGNFRVLSGGGVSTRLLGNSNTVVTNDNWYHIVFTYNSSNNENKIYIDGLLKSTTTEAPYASNQNFIMGRGQNSYYVNGLLDEVAIWNRTLSSGEIQTLFNNDSGLQHPFGNSDLLAFYPFNGNSNDESGNGNNGTIQGGVSLTTDRFNFNNKAMLFNGIDGYILVPNSTSLQSPNNSITLAGWVQINGYNGLKAAGIVNKTNTSSYGQYGLTYHEWNDPHRISFNFNQGNVGFSANTTLDLNKWFFVVSTYDGSTINIYLNGSLIGSNTVSGSIIADDKPVSIGLDSPGSSEYLNGKLDDIRIYNRALSESEIQELYHEGGWGNTSTVTDVDGNVYNTLVIGTQEWMAENLKTTKYNDGTSIPLVTEDATWAALSTPAYCWYSNSQTTYGNTYGALYNWFAVSTTTNGGKSVCPTGWHVPTDAEWTILETYLGGSAVAGGKMKEIGNNHWQSPNTGATNESGFSSLPSGNRNLEGPFYNIQTHATFWSSSENENTSWQRNLIYNSSSSFTYNDLKTFGFSVRCIKD